MLFALLLLFAAGRVSASHIAGGDITYRCLGANVYEIKLRLLSDCGGAGGVLPTPNTANVLLSTSSGCNSIALSLILNPPVTTLSTVCPPQANQSTCNGGNFPGYLFATYTGVVTLPSNCPDWTISYSLCCRNFTSNTSGNPTFYLESRITNSISCNSSPVFASDPVVTACGNLPGTLSFAVLDPEADSILYTLAAPLQGAGNPIPFGPGMSASQPILGMNTTLNASTGLLSFTPTSGGIGVNLFSVVVYAYRNGQLINQIRRDVVVSFVNCAQWNLIPPVIQAPAVIAGGQLNSNGVIAACVNQPLSIGLGASAATPPGTALVIKPGFVLPAGMSLLTNGTNPLQISLNWPAPQAGFYTIPIVIEAQSCPLITSSAFVLQIHVRNLCLDAIITDAGCNLPNGAIDLILNGGTAPFRYQWSNGDTTQDISGLAIGNYTVTVTDSTNATRTASFFVSGSSINLNASITQPTCQQPIGSVSLNPSGGIAPYRYQWSTGDTLSSVNTQYSVTCMVLDSTGCAVQRTFQVFPADSCFNLVRGKAYIDANNNCVQDPGEQGLAYYAVDITPGMSVFTDLNGEYVIRADSGQSLLELRHPAFSSTGCPVSGSYTLNFNGFHADTSGFDFAVTFVNTQDLRLSYNATGRTRPGSTVCHYLQLFNEGASTLSGTLSLALDSIFQFSLANPSATYLPATHSVVWSYSNLRPGQSSFFSVCMTVDTTAQMNTPWSNTATADPLSGDATPGNNVVTRNGQITAAYDPNDKLADPPGIGAQHYIRQDEDRLFYTVRFQNTGNDTAFLVVIRDTLSQHLDYRTLQVLANSHPFSLSLPDDREMVFRFDNILLPDSATDFIGSQGFVAYSIGLKTGVQALERIENRAAIYFDFNAPIITNTVFHTIAEPLSGNLGANRSICNGVLLDSRLSGGVPPYSYTWTLNGLPLSAAAILGPSASGSYALVGSDTLGQQWSGAVNISILPDPDAAFTVTPLLPRSYRFEAPAAQNLDWIWDFGDGQTSSGTSSVSHSYAQNGVYTVRLTTLSDCGTDHDSTVLSLNTALDARQFAAAVRIAPQPLRSESVLSFPNSENKSFTLQLYDLQGRLLRSYDPTRGTQFVLKRENLSPGVYLWQLRSDAVYTGKIAIE